MECSGRSVLLEGSNLRPSPYAMASYSCASVKAFDPNKRDAAADPKRRSSSPFGFIFPHLIRLPQP